jgi:ATP-dependent Lhr-like helicase
MNNEPPVENEKLAFELLHRKIQEELYRMKWTRLRPIQVQAIREVVGGDNHIILSAQTASGKTEAAFLPILSRIVEDHGGSVRVIYAGPLKALINDQFRRLEDLCERSAIPVHKWHGDVSQAAKKDLVQRPGGVLLITPESIESLFVNRSHVLGVLFARLEFIVIDEMHSFIGTERGAHLRSLISRLAAKSRQRVRMLGLSATLGDDKATPCRWLCPRDVGAVQVIEDPEGEKTVRYGLKGYLRALAEPPREKLLGGDDTIEGDELGATEDDRALIADVFAAFYGKTALIFANRKERLELYADLIARQCERSRLPNLFRVHHGSLSKGVREEAEEALRSDIPTATLCSSTLEMGIDVGNVKSVGQIGTPWSVTSLIQRLGRSGRGENEPAEMRVFIEEDEPDERSPLINRLFPRLLQAVAMTELMLEKWCEPPEIDRLHASTLVQQILSVIKESGGARADRLFDVLVTTGAFVTVDKPTLVQVLRSMGEADLIQQTPEGELFLGDQGERIVSSKDFYAVFKTPEEFKVVHAGRGIGSIAAVPDTAADQYVILGGRRWKVLEVNLARKEILVEPSRAGRLPAFAGTAGSDIHPRVREKMRALLFAHEMPAYLDARAGQMLGRARRTAREAHLDHCAFFRDGSEIIWFTWTGSRINRTLLALGLLGGKLRVTDSDIALTFERTSLPDIQAAYQRFLADPPVPEELASPFPVKVREKYDAYLCDALLTRIFARDCLDLDSALNLIRASTWSCWS